MNFMFNQTFDSFIRKPVGFDATSDHECGFLHIINYSSPAHAPGKSENRCEVKIKTDYLPEKNINVKTTDKSM